MRTRYRSSSDWSRSHQVRLTIQPVSLVPRPPDLNHRFGPKLRLRSGEVWGQGSSPDQCCDLGLGRPGGEATNQDHRCTVCSPDVCLPWDCRWRRGRAARRGECGCVRRRLCYVQGENGRLTVPGTVPGCSPSLWAGLVSDAVMHVHCTVVSL